MVFKPKGSATSSPSGSSSKFRNRSSVQKPGVRGSSTGGFKKSFNRGGSFGGPKKFGGQSRGGSRGQGGARPGAGSRGGNGRGKFERIDVSRFISKATIVEKEEIYMPTHTFADFAIEAKLKTAIANKKYIYPSPIQDKAIPHALEGRDILGIANTGTGKTAAFLIPLINKVMRNNNETVLILAPTRELAIQIEKEFVEFTKGMNIYGVVCVGGAPIYTQIRNLRRSCNFIIGTPGRIMDLIDRKEIYLDKNKSVVLDEADRMLDMGFVNDITKILAMMPGDKQCLFFSATFPKAIEKLVEKFTRDAVHVMVKTRDTSKNVEQDIIRMNPGTTKIDVLEKLLKGKEFSKVLIFAEMKHVVEKLSIELKNRGFKAGSIHGDKRHNDRQRTLAQFKDNALNILVATDVAARGLDIPDVTHVINYEIPQTYDTYIHRIGRTGRASAKGVALTFV